MINYNILQIEAKDIVNAGSKGYKIKENKKFKSTLDASLELDKIIEVAQDVYSQEEFSKLFYNVKYKAKDKYHTKAVISITFEYNLKEYNKQTINKKSVYVHHSVNKELKENDFVKGFYIGKFKDDECCILGMIVNEPLNEIKTALPKGFTIADDNSILADEIKIRTITNTEDLRKKLYADGCIVEGRKYIRFKRSSGSSKEGKCLFILDKLYSKVMDWTLMNLDLSEDKECDLAGLEAYFSLTTSSIIDYITIEPKNILLIDEYKSRFTDKVMKTRLEVSTDDDGNIIYDTNGQPKKHLVTDESENEEIENNIWDGQSIIDTSLMVGDYADKGFLLVRNRFVKSACFHANIQKFFEDNDITEISQINGKTVATDIKDIKLITTKSSIKFLKYNTWEKYIEQCSTIYGIVKYEKPQQYDEEGSLVQSHYQLLNTLQINEKEVEKLLQPSIDYLKLLKNDLRVFRHHLKLKINENVRTGEINNNDEFVMFLLELNDDVSRSDLFVNFRQDIVDNYVKNMRKGHILIHGTYAVMCSCGLEMLMHSIKDKNDNSKSMFTGKNECKSILGENELYCEHFKDGEKLIVSRAPHVASGNVLITKNSINTEINEYFFKGSKNIVHISSIGNNIMERLSSCDFDSDSILISNDATLYAAGAKNYDRFLVPTSKCDININLRYPTLEQKAELDIICASSQSVLGDVVNTSQILNSYMWQMLKDNKDADITQIYKDICQLDVLSTLVIDSSKREIPIDFDEELDGIRNKYVKKALCKSTVKVSKDRNGKEKKKYINELAPEDVITAYENADNQEISQEGLEKIIDILKKYTLKTVRPAFFEYVGEGKDYLFMPMDTTMDYLQNAITKMLPQTKAKSRVGDNKVITIGQILNDNIKLKTYNQKQANRIIADCKTLKDKVNAVWAKENVDGKEKYKEANELKDNFVKALPDTIMISTLRKIIYDYDQALIKYDEAKKNAKKKGEDIKDIEKDDILGFGRMLLSALYAKYPSDFAIIFKDKKKKLQSLERVNRDIADGEEVITLYNLQYVVNS